MSDDTKANRTLSRRTVLRGGSAALIGLGAAYSGLAHAAPGRRSRMKAVSTRGRRGGGAPTLNSLPGGLSNEERALAAAIADAVKHAATVAAANPDARFANGSYAGVTQLYLRGVPRSHRDKAKANAVALLSAPLAARQRNFHGFAGMTVKTHQGTMNPFDVRVAQRATAQAISRKRRVAKAKPSLSKGGITKIKHAKYSRVGFFLNEVKCYDETDGEGGDSDEVALGGVAISPIGTIAKISPFEVSDDFDKGERVKYYPSSSGNYDSLDPYRGRTFAAFDLGEAGNVFPGSYTLSLTMVETDNGSFAAMLNQLWAKVAADVKKAIKDAGKEYLGDFGVLLAEIINAVLDDIVAFLVNLFTGGDDDLIAEVTGRLALNSPNKAYFASLPGRESRTPSNVWAAQRQKWNFVGDGGRYRIKMHWRVW